MQERYLGDVHDYHKFMFLKKLSLNFDCMVGCNWYLVNPNEIGESEIKKNEFLKDGDDKIVYVMNDKTLYGEKVCNFTFAQAREVGAICPYKILISVVTKKDLSVYTIKKSNVLIDGEEISAEQFALQLAVKAAVKKFKTKKVFTFHHRCSSASSFVKKENPEGIQRHLKDFYTGYVDGAMSMSNRTDIMSLFKDHEKSLVS